MSWQESVSELLTTRADEHGELFLAFGTRSPGERHEPATQAFIDSVQKLWDESRPPGMYFVRGWGIGERR